MIARIKSALRILFGREKYPDWAYNLDCKSCKTCWNSPKAHFRYVMEKVARQHGGK